MGAISPSLLSASLSVKRIAIIGAGPSGLAAAKYLRAAEAFSKIDVFEQQPKVGGVWLYTPEAPAKTSVPQTTPQYTPDKPLNLSQGPIFPSPMYETLHTNIPKSLMGYSDFYFADDCQLFPQRETVQEYLEKYAEDILPLISFSTQVESVTLAQSNGQDQWELRTKNVRDQKTQTSIYDALVIANGHYNVPFIPSYPGISEWNDKYPGSITHSKTYRSPGAFSNKKVLLIGNRASAIDIGRQIAPVCAGPLLNSVRDPPENLAEELRTPNKVEVKAIASFNAEDQTITFEDGRVEADIDKVIFCTGYLYAYQFLENSGIVPPVVTNGRRVRGLYKQFLHINHPTLAFTGLPQKVIPFPLSEGQSAVLARIWSGQLPLPSKSVMKQWEAARVGEKGDVTDFHVLGYPEDADYINEFHDWAMAADPKAPGKEPPLWDDRMRWTRKNYVDIQEAWTAGGKTGKSLEEVGFNFDAADNDL